MRTRVNSVLSITALLVAIGGATPVGEAAWNQLVPRNSVGTQQLKRNAVKARQLAPNAVRAAHVLNGSLLAVDFKEGQIPQGPKGDKGEKGDRGEPGPTEGATAVDTVETGPTTLTDQYGSSAYLASRFTTTRAGRLFLVKSFSGDLTCTSSAKWWWLTLDGQPVPSSVRFTSQTAAAPLTLDGVTAQPVAAGQHTLSVGAMCFAGSSTGSSTGLYSSGSAVVLG